MASRLSRRKIAAYAADKLIGGSSKKEVLREVAAYLITTRRTRELELLVRDIEDLGGVRIDLPGKRFDGTILRKLTALKAKQL